jgi:hypothetical protein
MLYWISETYGKPSPNELFKWLVGELPPGYYDVIDPFYDGSGTGKLGTTSYKEENGFDGLSNQKVWSLFRNGSLDPTGFFEWMEKEKSISSFKFLSELQKSTGLIDPIDLLFFATSPDLVQFIDGSLSFMHHDALDSQNTNDPTDALWNYFDQENFDEEAFFKLLDTAGFNLFDIFMELKIDPASWLNVLDEKYGLLPIEVIKRMKKINPEADQYIEFDNNGKTVLNISASLSLTYSGINLKDIDATIAPDKILEASVHFDNFIPSELLRGENFRIL